MKITATPTKKTYSVCPVCLKRIPAKLVLRDGSWYMEKACAEHGSYTTVVWRGSASSLKGWGNYHPPKENEADLPNCPDDCGLCDKHLQSTCCVLVEVTDRCNLRCPVCFAESGDEERGPAEIGDKDGAQTKIGDEKGTAEKSEGGKRTAEKSVDELFGDFKALIEKECRFIQLSGGEPTVRDDLPEIVAAAKKAGATSVQLNSNGLRLGKEPEYTKRLADAGLDFVFMQFDGMDDEVYKTLRGRPMLKEKLEAIKVCGDNGIGVTLVPTVVPGVNDRQIGAVIKFGMERSPAVRGVHFQPISYFGRYPEPPKDENRITLPEILTAIEEQTDGLIKLSDLAPSACDHPRCGFHSDFVILPDQLICLTPKASEASDCCCCKPSPDEALRNRNFVARRWKRNLELEQEAAKIDQSRCCSSTADADKTGCCSSTADADETGCCSDMMDFDTFLARVAANGFTVTGMAFQDAYNLDLERLRRCSLHVYDGGRIVPFCARYLTNI
ncbi:MAG TPA: radical SAM protein [Bacillota bacterium]|nr:radical SAM protein [Bacillota bacterium]